MKYFYCTLLFFFAKAYGSQCPVDPLAKYTWHTSDTGTSIVTTANAAQMTPEHINLNGDVEVQQGTEQLRGSKLSYNRRTQEVRSDSPVTYGTPTFALSAQTSDYNLASSTGTFKTLEYYLKSTNAQGDALSANIDQNANTEVLVDATYSTCARNKRSWSLKAKEIILDHKNNIGKAWHTTFRIADVPVFYFPYFDFPLNGQRKSGFLQPKISLSTNRGFELSTPYYINIAPNQDATITPRWMDKQGLMIGAEYRYLMENLNGRISGDYLISDKNNYQRKRWQFETLHTYQPTDKLKFQLHYQRVSDKAYRSTFEESFSIDSASFMESYANMHWAISPNYTIDAKINDYQVITPKKNDGDKPYQLMPRVTGKGSWSNDGFVVTTETDATNFYKKNALSGWRFNQTTVISYPMRASYGFITPTLRYQFTDYRLKNQGESKKHHTRSIPSLSIDSGLFFDREVSLFGHDVTQTLEPRAFYLYTPYRQQSHLPNFDSGQGGLSYASMFLPNRFNGNDRIGDANQLTTAVSSKFFSRSSGKELGSVSLGQVQYFSDRKVGLSSNVETIERSNIVFEGKANLYDSIALTASGHYNTNDKRTERSQLGITYHPEVDRSISVAHSFDRDKYKQVDVGAVWRINDSWRTFMRWRYSVDKSMTADAIAGIEYSECCWGVRLLARKYRDNLTSSIRPETAFYLEFSLDGLGSAGRNTSNILSSAIPNYRPTTY